MLEAANKTQSSFTYFWGPKYFFLNKSKFQLVLNTIRENHTFELDELHLLSWHKNAFSTASYFSPVKFPFCQTPVQSDSPVQVSRTRS